MKRLLTLILLLSGLIVQAQNPVVINQPYNFTKYLIARDSLKITHAPSLLDSSDKAITSAWIKQQTFAGVNIYNSDGTLTDNRIVNLNKKNINWIGGNNFGIEANNEFYVEDSNGTKTLESDGKGYFAITDKLSSNSTFVINKYGGLFGQNVIHGNNTITSYGGGDFQLNNGRTNAVTMKIDSTGSLICGSGTTGLKTIQVDSLGNTKIRSLQLLDTANNAFARLKYTNGHYVNYDYTTGLDSIIAYQNASSGVIDTSYNGLTTRKRLSLDSLILSNATNHKLNISDTPMMLNNYLTQINSLVTDSVYQSNQIALRLKYTDSANMLLPYAKTFQIPSLTGYLKFSDTGRLTAQIVTGGTLNKVSDSLVGIDNKKVNYTDSGRLAASWVTGGSLNKVRDSLQANINAKGTVTSVATDYGLTGGTITTTGTFKVDSTVILPLSSITLNSSGAVHLSPITFTRLGGAWSGQMTLASQSAYSVLGRASGSGTPSFVNLDSNYFNSLWYSYVRGSLSAGRGATFTSGAFGLDTTKNYTFTGVDTFKNKIYTTQTIGQFMGNSNAILQLGSTSSTNQYFAIRRVGGSTGVFTFYLGGADTSTDNGFQYLRADQSGEFRNFNGSGSGYYTTWYSGGAERMRLSTTNFNLLIGTTNDASAADKIQVNGNVNLITAGNKIKITTGSNASVGSATFASGTVTLTNTCIASTSKVFVTITTASGTTYGVYQRGTTGTSSMVINSLTNLGTLNAADNSTFDYWIIN